MAVHAYENALQLAESLSPEEQLRLLAELTARLSKTAPTEKKHSIMELCGRAKRYGKASTRRNMSGMNERHGMDREAVWNHRRLGYCASYLLH